MLQDLAGSAVVGPDRLADYYLGLEDLPKSRFRNNNSRIPILLIAARFLVCSKAITGHEKLLKGVRFLFNGREVKCIVTHLLELLPNMCTLRFA